MHTNQSVYCQAAKVRRPRARSKKRKKRRLVPAHRLPTQPDAANASPNWAGEEEPAACIDHRLRATRAISAEHYALAYVLLGGAPPHPRRGPAHRRQHRQVAGVPRRSPLISEDLTRLQRAHSPIRAMSACVPTAGISLNRRFGPRPCENSTRYNRTRNFEACGHAQSKKMQKFLLRSALQPN